MTIRTYTSELIRACFEKRTPAAIPDGITAKELLEIARTGQIQYPFASSLIKLDISEEDAEIATNYSDVAIEVARRMYR